MQWTATTDHVARLEGLLRRALDAVPGGDLPADTVLAISPDPSLAEQGFYLYLWTAYLLPELEVRRVTRPEEGLGAEYWLVFEAAAPSTAVPRASDAGSYPRAQGWQPLARRRAALLPTATLYRVPDDGSTRPAPRGAS